MQTICRWSMIMVAAACALPFAFARSQAAEPAPADTARALLQPFVDRRELAGAVMLVADKDDVLAVETVGFADIADGRTMTDDTMFWIASQTKPMTAVALMMLVEEGTVSLDDPIEKHLPEFRGQMCVAWRDEGLQLLRKPAQPVTLRMLLSHLSGLPYKTPVQEPTLDQLPLVTVGRAAAMTPLLTEPGTAYLYSNAGINTAARVIEVVTDIPCERFLQERLFDPLGMNDTTFWPNEEQCRRLAASYRPDAAGTGLVEFPIAQLLYPLGDRTHRHANPSGGLFSTAQDTARFCRMILNQGELDGRRYLKPESVRELTRRQTPTTLKDSYGLGFAVGPDWYGHGGAHATLMEIRPADGLVLVWLVQHGGFPGEGAKAVAVFRDWARRRYAR